MPENEKPSETRVRAADLDFPEELGASMGTAAHVTGKPPEEARARLALGIESGIAQEQWLNRADFEENFSEPQTYRVRFNNGTEAIRERYHPYAAPGDPDEYLPVLASQLGEIFGAPVPAVIHGALVGEIYMEVMPGRTAENSLGITPEMSAREMAKRITPFLNSRSGIAIGLLDAVTGNIYRAPDRWLITDDSQIFAIGNRYMHPSTNNESEMDLNSEGPPVVIEHPQWVSPFADRWFVARDSWKANPLHPSEVAIWREEIMALRSAFEDGDKVSWFHGCIARLNGILAHAIGAAPLLEPQENPSRAKTVQPGRQRDDGNGRSR